jgi:hypothetical protein
MAEKQTQRRPHCRGSLRQWFFAKLITSAFKSFAPAEQKLAGKPSAESQNDVF